MDTQNQDPNSIQPRNKKGRIYGGIFLLAIGFLFFLREIDIPLFPHWLFTWPMILIAVGIYTGLKHNFRGAGWLIPIIIGVIFLVDRFDIGFDLHRFIFPIIIIGIGLTMILRPKRDGRGGWDNWSGGRYRRDRSGNKASYNLPPGAVTTGTATDTAAQDYTRSSSGQAEDYIDAVSVLGSTHRIVVSKNFKGGEITCFMGGAEIDMSHADINGTVVLDVTTIMGGAKLIVPTNWEVKPEITNVLGGVEDKRQVQGKVIDFNKVLLLKGTSFMGGIELRSF
jgi:predicted membrane protein